jgi:hypothetical protein
MSSIRSSGMIFEKPGSRPGFFVHSLSRHTLFSGTGAARPRIANAAAGIPPPPIRTYPGRPHASTTRAAASDFFLICNYYY